MEKDIKDLLHILDLSEDTDTKTLDRKFGHQGDIFEVKGTNKLLGEMREGEDVADDDLQAIISVHEEILGSMLTRHGIAKISVKENIIAEIFEAQEIDPAEIAKKYNNDYSRMIEDILIFATIGQEESGFSAQIIGEFLKSSKKVNFSTCLAETENIGEYFVKIFNSREIDFTNFITILNEILNQENKLKPEEIEQLAGMLEELLKDPKVFLQYKSDLFFALQKIDFERAKVLQPQIYSQLPEEEAYLFDLVSSMSDETIYTLTYQQILERLDRFLKIKNATMNETELQVMIGKLDNNELMDDPFNLRRTLEILVELFNDKRLVLDDLTRKMIIDTIDLYDISLADSLREKNEELDSKIVRTSIPEPIRADGEENKIVDFNKHRKRNDKDGDGEEI